MVHSLNINNINPNHIKLEYAILGPMVQRAAQLEKDLKSGLKKRFDQVIRANLGDGHALGQKPITFARQLMTLVMEPSLMDILDYPPDVKQRATEILNGCKGGSIGSYTDSFGMEVIRRQVADFIQKRDKVNSDYRNIILTSGATAAIKLTLEFICHTTDDGKKSGVLIPIPTYPLYSATIVEFDMVQMGYYLDEDDNWALNINEIKRAFDEGKEISIPRVLVVINPGNPTGQVLTRENIVEIIKFAFENNLLIIADEVYQENIYDVKNKFFSFKKIIHSLGPPYNRAECVNIMSASKGFLGECGLRGGAMEVINIDPNVRSILQKLLTVNLCATTIGQVAVSAFVKTPIPGDPSYERFKREKEDILFGYKDRAELMYDTMNFFEGFHMNPIQGAIYGFPRIEIPKKAIEAAKAAGKTPDDFYCLQLLEATGICVIPGSGFGQKPGTYHFRTTVLPPMDKLKVMLEKFRLFHLDFISRFV